MGLSSDPVKRRRQLAGLQAGARARLARLESLAAECDEPGTLEPGDQPGIEPRVEPGSTAALDEPSARPTAGIVPGTYAPAAKPAPAPADVALDEHQADELDDELEDELEHVDEPGEPSRRLQIAAQLLGVRRP